jgi:hypothetical protein
MMKKCLLYTLLLSAFAAAAQPTLTSTCNYAAGQSYVHSICDAVIAGPSGANATWDFSTLNVTATDTFGTVACPGDPDCASHPGTTLIITQPNVSYKGFTIEDANRYSDNGSAIDTTYAVIASDPEDYLRYPFTYGDTFTDSFSRTSYYTGDTVLELGADADTADGWGTLILPAHTYTNALRVHCISRYRDSSLTTGFTQNYLQESWRWYVPGMAGYRLIIGEATLADSTPIGSPYTSFSEPDPLAVPATASTVGNISIYPNPVREQLNLTGASGEITVYNTLGQLLMGTEATGNTGTLNTAPLDPGIYYLSIRDTKTGRTERLKFLKE